jgi:8-oxo-dGTP diphosphatase
MKLISAGIIIKNNKVLVCQRRNNSYYGLKWEFPGGKVEPGETIEECLVREIKEELNLDIQIDNEFHVGRHKYPDGFEFEIHFFIITKYSGKEQNKVFEKIEWATFHSLGNYDFLEADKDVIEILMKKYHPHV